ncbi:hypothetical protein J6590_100765 [Homalodisca vitripennis]|nr:hypothetical protein J6590_100765 [Homalodisca vitripennis]
MLLFLTGQLLIRLAEWSKSTLSTLPETGLPSCILTTTKWGLCFYAVTIVNFVYGTMEESDTSSEPSILQYSASDDYEPSDDFNSDDSRKPEPPNNTAVIGGEGTDNVLLAELPKKTRKRQNRESKRADRKKKRNSANDTDFAAIESYAKHKRQVIFSPNEWNEVILKCRIKNPLHLNKMERV